MFDFEIDSGSHVSTLRHMDAINIGAVISPSNKRLVGYSGDVINIVGQSTLQVSYNNRSFQHKFFIVNSNSVNLLGRDLCKILNISILVSDNDRINSVSADMLNKFKDYFSPDFKSSVKQTVHLNVLPNSSPKFCKARSVPVRMKGAVKTELQRLVDLGILTRVFESTWASPTVNVYKSDGSIRICGDFSVSVNQYLDPVQTPLPTIDEVIANIGNARVFSKIDLANAFLQLPLDESSKQFTTINTSDGLFKYNFLPFGLKASPGIFQSFMTKLLSGVNNIVVYQDDLLIMSPNMFEHNKSLNKVLTILRDAGIKLNANKCLFFTDKVQYLGHIFTENGVYPNSEKIRAINDAPAPVNVKQVQAFLGLCNFYSRFIPNFSNVMLPLYLLLKKNARFHWGSEQQRCFENVKKLFVSSKVLQYYNVSHETLLETDSSGYGVAAVLLQRESNADVWHPVQFASRSLNAAERNYSNIEREALSVVFGIEKFKKFLLGTQFIIRNDQQPLRKLFAHNAGVPTTCSARIQRWSLKLSQFNYTFQYSRGENNVHSDCLSRLPLPETVHEVEPYELVFAIDVLNNTPITCEQIKHQTDQDRDLVELKQYIKYGWPAHVNPNLSKYKNVMEHLSIMKGCIMYCNRVLIPNSLRSMVLQQFHEGHPGITCMKSLARSLIWYPGIDSDIVDLVKSCSQCQLVRSKPPQKFVEWPVPSRPWSRVHVDHFFLENKICLVAVDALSRYIECEIVHSTSVQDTVDALRCIFSRNGLCDVLVSDNATCFTAAEFKQFLNNNGISHITSPVYLPSSNGQAERSVRVIKDLMKKHNDCGSFRTRLAKVLFHYRCVPHSVTQIAPSVALNNRKFVTAKDRVNPKYCYSSISKNKTQQIPQFDIGQNVLALNLREGPKWYNATVIQKLGINVYNVHVKQLDAIWKRHINQLLSIPDEPSTQIQNNNNNSSIDAFNGNNSANTQSSVPLLVTDNSEVERRQSTRVGRPVSRYGFD